ncbi:platelet-activating factor acetylhydrolase IB subunit [Xanthomonas vesicatoria]|uniref:platelet-activating factor acetylhydrolase IB subunit n=1 Tax=Xanthomonas vesicatoria TaxID=56460 RepID=UPI001E50C204|nr:platelet-activating factor acetylhydrolase IB subunit [Xanthomonas vesicatoria]MCC8627920.1 GDSL-type esterase/lipase family protein [Xanthomonas vesicatoria]MDG4483621.1 acetylhydrolase [Xanthomonas vesicatoria]
MPRSSHAVFSRRLLPALARLLLCGGLVLVCTAAAAQTPPPSIVPTDRLQESWWAQRHAQVLDQVKQHPETKLLLIGDSITQNYEKSKAPDEEFQPTWQAFYGSRGALNLGFSGDGTENVLWRLANGEVDGLQPKVALVLIGTNNTGHLGQTAEQTQLGIDAVVAAIEQKLPRTHILLLSVLPSAISAEKSRRDAQINQGLAVRYGDNPRVTYLDVSSVFQRDGKLRTELFYDTRFRPAAAALHPDTRGQRMLAEAIEPTLARLLGEPPVKPVAELGRDVTTSLIPVDWLEQDSYDWYARHHAALAAARNLKPEVVMIGDSITHFWAGPPQATRVSGPESWQWLYGKRPVLNLGFGWDRTQNVLWRIRQGELDGLDPRWVVLHIGTNNLTGTAQSRASTPAETLQGVDAIVREVRTRMPNSKLILMAIMPRGHTASSPQRAPIAETNRLLRARYAADPSVRLVDIGKQLLQPDGSLPEALMPDGTHPSEAGYRIWAQALRDAGITAAP